MFDLNEEETNKLITYYGKNKTSSLKSNIKLKIINFKLLSYCSLTSFILGVLISLYDNYPFDFNSKGKISFPELALFYKLLMKRQGQTFTKFTSTC